MKDLAKLITENPGAIFTVDNDDWWMMPAPPKPIDDMTDEEHDAWNDISNAIAQAGDVTHRGGGGYGSGSFYGGDILQALAEIVGVKVGSV